MCFLIREPTPSNFRLSRPNHYVSFFFIHPPTTDPVLDRLEHVHQFTQAVLLDGDVASGTFPPIGAYKSGVLKTLPNRRQRHPPGVSVRRGFRFPVVVLDPMKIPLLSSSTVRQVSSSQRAPAVVLDQHLDYPTGTLLGTSVAGDLLRRGFSGLEAGAVGSFHGAPDGSQPTGGCRNPPSFHLEIRHQQYFPPPKPATFLAARYIHLQPHFHA